MRIRATAATAAALLLANSAASASEWVQVVQGTDGATFQVDVSSIRIEGEVRRAWMKNIYARHKMKGHGENAKKFVSYTLMHLAFNCPDQSMEADALMAYFEDGSSYTGNISDLAQFATWSPVPPDTALSSVMQSVCSWKPK
jgi:hypothetical protein